MGAGIPRAIPGALDRLAKGQPAELKIDVAGALPGEDFLSKFDPAEFCGGEAPILKRPQFLGIVSSATLAMALAKKASGRVDGFVVESDTAGGHNAPPRGAMQLSGSGEPVYGPRDAPDLEKIRELGLPFWLAGSYGQPGRLAEALKVGAAGVQIGTAFAFCAESGIAPELKQRAIQLSRSDQAGVFTDPIASPTGFPFKVVVMPGTLSHSAHYANRTRLCDLGYLRHLYRKPDGSVGYRCPAESEEDYVRKGGTSEDAQGRKCLCNGLMANIGLGQVRSGQDTELPLLTAGDDIANIARFLRPGADSYTAGEVLSCLLAEAVPGNGTAVATAQAERSV
jgi:NAD(P)H-dependent flavin oxidoreductase YrpB (nitropropane dioxygenase family)